MSTRQTRRSRQVDDNEKGTKKKALLTKNVSKQSNITSSPTRMTRSGSRNKNKSSLVSTEDIEKAIDQKGLVGKDVEVPDGKKKENLADINDSRMEETQQSNTKTKKSSRKKEQKLKSSKMGRSTPDLDFDHYKSKDKSFTSASHVKVIRPLEGETETGRKIYALTVSETSPRSSPKNILQSVPSISAEDLTEENIDSTERMEFEDGIILEMNEEQFGNEVHASQESFDSSYGSQEIEKSHFDNVAMTNEEYEDLPSSQESGISIGTDNPLCNKLNPMEFDSSESEDENAPKSPVTYPTSNQSQFFGMFGLIKKTEIPKDDPSKSKLHRAAGGKLRRNIKPNMTTEMVYDHKTKNRSSKVSSSVTLHSYGNNQTTVREKKQTEMEDVDETLKPTKYKKKIAKAQHKMFLKAPIIKKQKSCNSDNESDLFSNSSSEDETIDSEPINYTRQKYRDTIFDPGSEPALKELYDSDKTVKEEPVVAGIERSRRGKRKEWKHLLKANPDVYESVSDLEKQQQFITKQQRNISLPKKDDKGTIKSSMNSRKFKGQLKEDESANSEALPLSLAERKAKRKRQRERDKETSKMFDEVDSSKSYLDLYEEVMEKKGSLHMRKRKKKDWALAKMLLEEATELKKAKELGLDAPALMGVQSRNIPALVNVPSTHSGELSRRSSQNYSSPTRRKASNSPQKQTTYRSPRKDLSRSSNGNSGPDIKIEEECVSANVLGQIKFLSGGDFEIEEQDEPPEPENFIAILKQRKEKELKEEDANFSSPIKNRIPLVVPNEKSQIDEKRCSIPHMCNVCWVNDHMYCKNMKKTNRDLLPVAACLHYAPCKHFSKSAIEEEENKLKTKSAKRSLVVEVPVLKVETDPTMEFDDVDIEGMEENTPIPEKDNDLELGCDEDMHLSDNEINPVKGTELLSAQLNARANQIKNCLGITEEEDLPKTNGIVEFAPRRKDRIKDKDCHILWSTHAAEIIVATENTWYYPPKHLSVLYDREQGVPLGSRYPVANNKTILTRTAIPAADGKGKTTRVQIKVMPPTMNGKLTHSELSEIQKTVPKVIKVRVIRVDSRKIVILQLVGELDESVIKETVLTVEGDVIKEVSGSTSKSWPNYRQNINGVFGDIIAREAIKLVQTPRPYPSKQNLCMKVNSNTATIKVTDVAEMDYEEFVSDMPPKPKKKKIICKKDTEIAPIVKEKGVNLYGFPQVAWEIVKDTIHDCTDVEAITNVVKENINKFYGDDSLCIEGAKSDFVEHPVLSTNKSILKTSDVRVMSVEPDTHVSLLNHPLNKEQLRHKYEWHKNQNAALAKSRNEEISFGWHKSKNPDTLTSNQVQILSVSSDANNLDQEGIPKYILKPKAFSHYTPKPISDAAEDAIWAANKLLREIEMLKEKGSRELNRLGGDINLDNDFEEGEEADDNEEESDERQCNFKIVHSVLVSTAEALKEINLKEAHTKSDTASTKITCMDKSIPAMIEQWTQEGKEPALKDFPSTNDEAVTGDKESRKSTTPEVKEIDRNSVLQFGGEIEQKEKEVNPIKVNSSVPITQTSSEPTTSQDTKEKSSPSNSEGDGTSQTLTFTTKDIREKKPELIEYIKKASLAPVICTKLNAEKCSLNNMLVKVDALFTKLKAELEQKKCLLAAVRSEKYWLQDRQKSYSSKLMTAVDQSLQVTRHLKCCKRSKKRLKKSLANCARIKKDSKIESSLYKESQDWFITKLKQQQTWTDKKKYVWVINEEGRYEKQVLNTEQSSDINPRITDYWAAKVYNKPDKESLNRTSSEDVCQEFLPTDNSRIDNKQTVEIIPTTTGYHNKPRDNIEAIFSETNKNSDGDNKSVVTIVEQPTVKHLLKQHSESTSISINSSSSKPNKNIGTVNIETKDPIFIIEDEDSHDLKDSECDETITIITEAPKPKSSFSISKSILEPEYREHFMRATMENADSQVVIPMEHTSEFISSLFQKQEQQQEKVKSIKKSQVGKGNTDCTEPLMVPFENSHVMPMLINDRDKNDSTKKGKLSGVSVSSVPVVVTIAQSLTSKTSNQSSRVKMKFRDQKISLVVPASTLHKGEIARVQLPPTTSVAETLSISSSNTAPKSSAGNKNGLFPLNVTHFKPDDKTLTTYRNVVVMSPATYAKPSDTSVSTSSSKLVQILTNNEPVPKPASLIGSSLKRAIQKRKKSAESENVKLSADDPFIIVKAKKPPQEDDNDKQKTSSHKEIKTVNISESSSKSCENNSQEKLRVNKKKTIQTIGKDKSGKIDEEKSTEQESWSSLTYDQLESILDESSIPDATVKEFML